MANGSLNARISRGRFPPFSALSEVLDAPRINRRNNLRLLGRLRMAGVWRGTGNDGSSDD